MKYVNELEMLARNGNPAAQCDLGRLYSNGDSAKCNHQIAAKWFLKSAEQGFGDAQLNLGVLYAMGRGVPQDFIKAYKWSNLAMLQGCKVARELRDTVAAAMSNDQIYVAKRQVLKWKSKQPGIYKKINNNAVPSNSGAAKYIVLCNSLRNSCL